MRKRLIQVLGFLISSLGWVFVLCTIAMDYWRITQIGGQGGSFIIRVAWYWSNLWKDCFTDSTAVTNCRDFPVLWTVTQGTRAMLTSSLAYKKNVIPAPLCSSSTTHPVVEEEQQSADSQNSFSHCPMGPMAFIQGVRGLLMCGLTLGFFAVVLCFLGMECTYIGGADKTKDKMLLAGAVFHFAGSVSDVSAYCLYINRIARTTFAASIGPGVLRYDLGPPIFLGLVGCFFILLGAVFYAVTVYRVICPESQVVYAYGGGTYVVPRSRGRTLYGGYYKPSRQYGSYLGSGPSSSSNISKLSQTTPTKISERDAFV